ncbi:MAG: fibronectin type III domain-containing protein [Saprospiraceae bacterium]|nr:fibronectin type III domain-containing protein [Saprospiraceae bacterium]
MVTYYWVIGTNPNVTYGNGVDQGSTTLTTASTSLLSAGTTYYLGVFATTNCNNSSSGYTTSVSFTTNTSCTTPGNPVSINSFVTGQTTANLSWAPGNPPGSPAITYFWVIGTSSDVTYGNGVDEGSTSLTMASTSLLSAGITYYLRVYAITNCNNSSSGYATSASFTTNTDCIIPGTPVNVNASVTGQNSANLLGQQEIHQEVQQ